MKRPIAPARAVLLCAVITASVLGGCGNSGESKDVEGKEEDKTTTTEKPLKRASAVHEEEEVTLKFNVGEGA